LSYFLAFAGFCFLIVMHELGHFTAAKMVGMKVERFALFFPPLLFKVKKGETEYGVGAIPLGGYVRITGMNPHEEIPPEDRDRAYYLQPVWKRIFVIGAGPAVNFAIAFVILAALFSVQGVPAINPDPTAAAKVGSVQKDSPASEILQPGDRIVSADGVSGSLEKIRDQIASHKCAGNPKQGCTAAEPVELVLLRDGRRITVSASPEYDAKAKRSLLGFVYEADRYYEDVGVGKALEESVNRNWEVGKASVSGITKIFYDKQAREEVSGVVGSYEATRQSFDFDETQALYILALISLSLAIINLFPFLPLDGGHIFWALAEKVRGKAIPFEVLERVSVVGFVLVAFLFVIGLSNDVSTLRDGGDFLSPK
jgi:regulator of sigma E protease